MLTKARSLSPDKNRENLQISKHLFDAQCPETPKTDVGLAWNFFMSGQEVAKSGIFSI
jgi:hypothetical protein